MPTNYESDQDYFDSLPQEHKDHLARALAHKAGLGEHPGKYQGPPAPPRQEFSDEPTESELAIERMREIGPGQQTPPPGPLPPQEAVQLPEQPKKGRPPAQQHGQTPTATGAAAVQPEEPEGNF